MTKPALLTVTDLKTSFLTERGPVTAVDGVSFTVSRGETLGIVGESGCGKSVTADSIMRLLDEKDATYSGTVELDGRDLLSLPETEMRQARGSELAMIAQDSMSSLNPVFTIGNQVVEAITVHQKMSKKDAYRLAVSLLERTGVPDPAHRMTQYPHELSGGLRQRILIAMALSGNPKLLIADEPTTALDVTTQAQILALIRTLQSTSDMASLLITHDLGVVAEMCDRVIVMYLGQVVEEADVDALFDSPLHPYTRGLLASMPEIDGDRTQPLNVIAGRVPTLHAVPTGCRFAERCDFATDKCRNSAPPLEDVTAADLETVGKLGGDATPRKVRCWNWRDIPMTVSRTSAAQVTQ